MRAYLLGAALVAATIFAACGEDDDSATAPAAATAATATAVPAVPSAATPPAETRELVVMTHNSFAATRELIETFEREHNVTVEIVVGGDANQVVNRAILSAGNPEADVLFGVDNLTFQRAVEAGVFEDYEAARRDEIPADVLAQFGNSMAVTPTDYGFVNINFDRAAGDAPPGTFEDLLKPEWSGLLVVEDPATSSPGLQFLASTVAAFGEGGWQQFWRDLRANDVLITDGWSEAYYTHFSVYGGDRSLVVLLHHQPGGGGVLQQRSARRARRRAADGERDPRRAVSPGGGRGRAEGRGPPRAGPRVHRLHAVRRVPGSDPGDDVHPPRHLRPRAARLVAVGGRRCYRRNSRREPG